MKLHNTLTRTLEEFVPLDPARKRVGLYVCGPTVYDDPHIGHARSAFTFDVLRRYLRYKGYAVRFVRNVTDVDDKIIGKAKEELGAGDKQQATGDLRHACQGVAGRYLKSYHEMLERLDIEAPDIEPKATEHIDPMLDLISKLVLHGNAYEAGGDVYFSVRKFERYGRLSNRSLDDLKAGARVEPGEHKQDPLDFALWKAAKPDEPFWKSPWGPGRPGWHIECSAMSTHYLGDAFDIHGGGVDLIFPHHENEIAQAQAAGKLFANYWVHNGLVTVKGEKMSKSLGNFTTVERAMEHCGGNADVLKVLFLGAHYRSPIDYGPDQIQAAQSRGRSFSRVFDYAGQASAAAPSAAAATAPHEQLKLVSLNFEQAMDADLNTPQALACLDRLVDLSNEWRSAGQVQAVAEAAGHLRTLGGVIGLFEQEAAIQLSDDQRRKIAAREEARKRGDFTEADRLRQELLHQGVVVEDTSKGSVWRKK
jgi:cysteinyl-tRNA synthetase